MPSSTQPKGQLGPEVDVDEVVEGDGRKVVVVVSQGYVVVVVVGYLGVVVVVGYLGVVVVVSQG